MAVVYKKSELGSFLEQLPSLLFQYKQKAAERAYDTQMYFLKNEIDKSRELDRERRSLVRKSVEQGITKDLLDSIEGPESTVGYQDIIDANHQDLVNLNTKVYQANREAESRIDQAYTNLGYFELGKDLMFQMGDEDPTTASDLELEAIRQEARTRFEGLEGDALSNALEFIEHGAVMQDDDYWPRLAQKRAAEDETKKAEREIEQENIAYVRRAEASQYPTIRNIEGLDDDSKKQAFEESSSIAKDYTLMGHFELDEIAELGATQGGAGYDDVLPARFDYSDMDALEPGLRIKAKEYLEDKMGVTGYDEEAIQRYVDIASAALRGTDVLTTTGERERYKANVAFGEFDTPDKVSVLKASVSKAIYQDPEVQKVLGQKDQLATTLKSFVLDKDNNIREGKEWSDVKKEARKLGFTKTTYNQAIKTLAGITDTNILEIMYLEREDIRKLLKLTTGTTASSVLKKLNLYEREVQNRLIQTKRTVGEDKEDEEIDYKDLFGGG